MLEEKSVQPFGPVEVVSFLSRCADVFDRA